MSDPGMSRTIARVEVHPPKPPTASGVGIGVDIYLRLDSTIGRAAAKDPGAESVGAAARLMAASLWDTCSDSELREVDACIYLRERMIGVATCGRMGGEVVRLYIPVGQE